MKNSLCILQFGAQILHKCLDFQAFLCNSLFLVWMSELCPLEISSLVIYNKNAVRLRLKHHRQAQRICKGDVWYWKVDVTQVEEEIKGIKDNKSVIGPCPNGSLDQHGKHIQFLQPKSTYHYMQHYLQCLLVSSKGSVDGWVGWKHPLRQELSSQFQILQLCAFTLSPPSHGKG